RRLPCVSRGLSVAFRGLSGAFGAFLGPFWGFRALSGALSDPSRPGSRPTTPTAPSSDREPVSRRRRAPFRAPAREGDQGGSPAAPAGAGSPGADTGGAADAQFEPETLGASA